MSRHAWGRSIHRDFARYAIPSVLGMVVSSLYTVVDGIFVGRGVGSQALGSINIVYPFIMLQIALAMLVAIGGANIYSTARGRGDSNPNAVFVRSLAMLCMVSLAVNLAAMIFSGPAVRLLGADATLMPQAQRYLFWMAAFGVVYMPGLGLSIFVRNAGAPGLELAGTLCGAIINIILDYVFIFPLGMGVEGAAIASGIGQMVSVAIYASYFLRKKRGLHLCRPTLPRREVAAILHNGFSSFLMEFSQSSITLGFNMAIMAHMGPGGVAAYSVVMYVCSIFNMVLIGIVQGAQPIMSFCHGAAEEENERTIYRLGIVCSLAATTVFYGLILIFGGRLAGLFSQGDTAMTGLAAGMMRIYFLGFFPIGVSLMNILRFQTGGRENRSIVVSALRCMGFVHLSLLILPRIFGPAGIYFSLLTGEALNCAVSLALSPGRQRLPLAAKKDRPAL